MDPSIGPGRPDPQIRPLHCNPVIWIWTTSYMLTLWSLFLRCVRCNGIAFYDRPRERALTCEEIRFTTWPVEHDCDAALSELVLITISRHTHASIGTCCSYAPPMTKNISVPDSFSWRLRLLVAVNRLTSLSGWWVIFSWTPVSTPSNLPWTTLAQFTFLARRSKEDRGIWTIGGSWDGRHHRAHDDVSPDWTLMPMLNTLSETIPSL